MSSALDKVLSASNPSAMELLPSPEVTLNSLLALAGCSLDEKPGSNWVSDAGGLPEFICETAKAIKKDGKTTSQAIAIAVSRMKVWAATGKPETKAKASAALAQWAKIRAKAKSDNVKASAGLDDIEQTVYLAASFNLDMVRRAYSQTQESMSSGKSNYSYKYVREVWSDFVIVEDEGIHGGDKLTKVPYTVASDGSVVFEEPVPVVQKYVEVPTALSNVLAQAGLIR